VHISISIGVVQRVLMLLQRPDPDFWRVF